MKTLSLADAERNLRELISAGESVRIVEGGHVVAELQVSTTSGAVDYDAVWQRLRQIRSRRNGGGTAEAIADLRELRES